MILIDLQVDCPALCPLNDACRMLPSGGLQEEAQEPSFYMRGSKGLRGSPMVNFRAHFLRSLVAFTTYVFADWHIFILHLIWSSLLSCRSPRHPSPLPSRHLYVQYQSNQLFLHLLFGRTIFIPRIPLQARWYRERVQYMLLKLYFPGCA